MELNMENQRIVSDKIIYTKKPKFMRISKIMLILTAVVLYIMQILVFVPMMGIMTESRTFNLSLPAVFIVLAVSILLGLTAFILAIVGGVKNESPSTLVTVIVKACLIPFFGINLYCWILGLAGMMNPFLMFGIPAVGFIGICLTYVYMFMTSAPDIVYTIIFCIKNKKRPTALMIVGVILEFFFLSDLVGAILLHKTYKDITIEDSIR